MLPCGLGFCRASHFFQVKCVELLLVFQWFHDFPWFWNGFHWFWNAPALVFIGSAAFVNSKTNLFNSGLVWGARPRYRSESF